MFCAISNRTLLRYILIHFTNCFCSAAKSVIDRIYKFWLWDDLAFRISPSGQSFYKSVKVLHDFTDNVCANF